MNAGNQLNLRISGIWHARSFACLFARTHTQLPFMSDRGTETRQSFYTKSIEKLYAPCVCAFFFTGHQVAHPLFPLDIHASGLHERPCLVQGCKPSQLLPQGLLSFIKCSLLLCEITVRLPTSHSQKQYLPKHCTLGFPPPPLTSLKKSVLILTCLCVLGG